MSHDHRRGQGLIVRGVGSIPGTAATLSTLVSRSHYEHWKIPLFEPQDAEKAKAIVNRAVDKIASRYKAACSELQAHYVDVGFLEDILDIGTERTK